MTKNYVSLVGGLGNQLFQYANARANNPEKKLQLIFEFGVKNQKRSLNKEITDLTIDNYDSITFVKRLFRVKRILHNLILRTSFPLKSKENFLSFRRILHSFTKLIFNFMHLGRISIISQNRTGFSKSILSTNQKDTFQIGYFQHYKWENCELVNLHLKSLNIK
jgi:hypothetical protein